LRVRVGEGRGGGKRLRVSGLGRSDLGVAVRGGLIEDERGPAFCLEVGHRAHLVRGRARSGLGSPCSPR